MPALSMIFFQFANKAGSSMLSYMVVIAFLFTSPTYCLSRILVMEDYDRIMFVTYDKQEDETIHNVDENLFF